MKATDSGSSMFNGFKFNSPNFNGFKPLAIAFIALFGVMLTSCSVGVSGLQSYIDAGGGYEFLYPNGWMQVSVKDAEEGVDVIFRDLIQTGENLSVVISNVSRDRDLSQLGSPTAHFYSVTYQQFRNFNRS
jgi:photosystem II oxygen-evolving enhancer protein 2